MSQLLQSIAGFFGFAATPTRQTSIGLQVPYPEPASRSEAIANLEYAQSEVKRCEASITHVARRGEIHKHEAQWYLNYFVIALEVANEVDMSHCKALSNAALSVLPRINPYAEMEYDFGTHQAASVSLVRLMDLASEYKLGALKLGRAILDAKPDARCLQPGMTMQEDYDSHVGSDLPAAKE